MKLTVFCPHPRCGQPASVNDTQLGQVISCPHCRQPYTATPSTDVAAAIPLAEAVLADYPAPVPPPDSVPPQLGRFLIRSRLGSGAFGTVYRAYDPQLDREVALKVPLPGTLDSPQRVERFLREARASAHLRHPHIVPLFDAGGQPPHCYIASAYVAGGTLTVAIAERRLDFRLAAQVVRQLAEALAYAHGQGIVHRDVKPANVILDGKGQAHLLDFGLAHRKELAKLTQAGAVLGTPAYMAPEQALRADDEEPQPASDQYSLGVVLYELLTGRVPFEGPAEVVLFHATQTEPEPPRAVNAQVPRDLETVCLKCLTKRPADRYPDCQALADDLRRWLEGEPIQARRLSWRERTVRWMRKEPKLAASLTAVALTMLSAIVLLSLERAKTAQAQQARALSQVDALLEANPQAVPTILQNLELDRSTIAPRLRELQAQPDLGEERRTRVSLALLPEDTSQVEYLRGRLLAAEPAELVLIRDQLRPHRERLTAGLWAIARDEQADADRRFRAAVVLAAFDPDSPRWADTGRRIVVPFLGANPLHLSLYAEALRPVRGALLPALAAVCRDPKATEQRQAAATVLADYAADRPEVLVNALLDADARQFPVLFRKLTAHRSRALSLLKQELDRPAPGREADAKDAQARRQAQAAVALLQLGAGERVWPLLQHTPEPRVRSYLIHLLSPLGGDPQAVAERLEREQDVSIRRALILCLGEYPATALAAAVRGSLATKLLTVYRDDPDPGIHSAVDWLLRQRWGRDADLQRIDAERAGQPAGPRRWYVNTQGQTFAVVPVLMAVEKWAKIAA